jgi:hypothetical protein
MWFIFLHGMSSTCAVELLSNVTDSNYNFERIEKAGQEKTN